MSKYHNRVLLESFVLCWGSSNDMGLGSGTQCLHISKVNIQDFLQCAPATYFIILIGIKTPFAYRNFTKMMH